MSERSETQPAARQDGETDEAERPSEPREEDTGVSLLRLAYREWWLWRRIIRAMQEHDR